MNDIGASLDYNTNTMISQEQNCLENYLILAQKGNYSEEGNHQWHNGTK